MRLSSLTEIIVILLRVIHCCGAKLFQRDATHWKKVQFSSIGITYSSSIKLRLSPEWKNRNETYPAKPIHTTLNSVQTGSSRQDEGTNE